MILDLQAKDVGLGDVVNEGEEVWLIKYATGKEAMTIYVGPPGCCLINPAGSRFFDCDPEALMRIVRR